MKLPSFTLTAILILAASLLMFSCESRITSHGRLIDEADLKKINIGETSKATVLELFGPPSFSGAFNASRLYYNNQKVEKKVAGQTQTIDRELLVLSFDIDDILQTLEIRDKSSDLEIVKLDASTPTPGVTLTIIDQIFANLRRNSATRN